MATPETSEDPQGTTPPLSVAVVQLDADADPAVCRQRATEAIARAANAGARLVVLPEYSSGWAGTITPDLAEPLDGPFGTALREAARAHGVHVLAGMVLPADDPAVATIAGPEELAGRGANVTAAVGADGAVLGTYTKVHLFDAFGVRESAHLVPGAVTGPDGGPLVVDVGGLRVGVLTCYDLRFPESARRLVDAGATVIAVGAAWASGPGKAEQLEVLVRARAIESGAYLLLASQCGRGRSGYSAVIDPRGEILTQAGRRDPTMVTADLDRALVSEARALVPSLEHRRFAVVPRD